MILIFGSVNVDLLMSVSSLPKPGETVLTKEIRQTPGGKGANQAFAAQRAGAKTVFVGSVGADGHAELALSLLKEQGVDLSLVKVSARSTGCAVILVDKHGENSIAVASGANVELRADQVDENTLKNSDVLLLQQEVSPEENFRLACRARQRNIKVIYNLAPASKVPREFFQQIDYLVLNEIEASLVVGRDAIDNPAEVAAILSREHGITVVITLGAKGAVAASRNNLVRLPAPAVEIVDTTGAGDTFCGYFAVEVAKERNPMASCLKIAIQAASIACTRPGAQPGIPHRHEVP
jgi:ribokinase